MKRKAIDRQMRAFKKLLDTEIEYARKHRNRCYARDKRARFTDRYHDDLFFDRMRSQSTLEGLRLALKLFNSVKKDF